VCVCLCVCACVCTYLPSTVPREGHGGSVLHSLPPPALHACWRLPYPSSVRPATKPGEPGSRCKAPSSALSWRASFFHRRPRPAPLPRPVKKGRQTTIALDDPRIRMLPRNDDETLSALLPIQHLRPHTHERRGRATSNPEQPRPFADRSCGQLLWRSRMSHWATVCVATRVPTMGRLMWYGITNAPVIVVGTRYKAVYVGSHAAREVDQSIAATKIGRHATFVPLFVTRANGEGRAKKKPAKAAWEVTSPSTLPPNGFPLVFNMRL